jgi:hypothetical protein
MLKCAPDVSTFMSSPDKENELQRDHHLPAKFTYEGMDRVTGVNAPGRSICVQEPLREDQGAS